jgi:dihydroorotate dehydrogenase
VKIILNIRDAINSVIYKRVLKRIFFTMDPEVIHDRMTAMGKLFGRISIGRWLIRLGFYSNSKSLHQDLKGIRFYSPVGLAAGFDKNAELVQILPELGFGFAELGSVTGEKCSGNPKPRLWRLKKSEALVVYYGLKNDGAEMISARLKNVLPKVRNVHNQLTGHRTTGTLKVTRITDCEHVTGAKAGTSGIQIGTAHKLLG